MKRNVHCFCICLCVYLIDCVVTCNYLEGILKAFLLAMSAKRKDTNVEIARRKQLRKI